MQTFLTHSDFNETAKMLDSKRLNKQLLEGRQIFNLLTYRTGGAWSNHPATLMWKGYERMFYQYLCAIYNECNNRGIKTDKNWAAIQEMYNSISFQYNTSPNVLTPWWMTDAEMLLRIIQTHRANLYKKDPEYYYEYEINAKLYDEMRDRLVCCDKCNYCWASHIAKQRQEKEMQDWLSKPLP